jgi:hypothetical protein
MVLDNASGACKVVEALAAYATTSLIMIVSKDASASCADYIIEKGMGLQLTLAISSSSTIPKPPQTVIPAGAKHVSSNCRKIRIN